MTTEQLQFITDNMLHFDLVLLHNQQFDVTHDITKRVLIIGQEITGQPFDQCGCSIKELYQKVWDQYVIETAA